MLLSESVWLAGIKTPTGKVSRLQVYNLEKILRAGGYGAVVRSVDDARALLDKIPMDLPREKCPG